MAKEQAARPRQVRTRLMGVLRLFIGRIPPLIGNPIADRLGDLAYRVAPRSRRAVISNMWHVMGPVPRPVLKKTVRGVFRSLMRNYYDLCRAPDMTNEEIDRVTDFDMRGWARIVELHNQKRGVVLVTGHFGAFDVITQVISRRGLPVTFLIAQFKPSWLSDFITGLRADRGLNLIPVDEVEGSGLNIGALKRSITLLRSGEILGVVADRNMEQRGVTIKFFGHDTVVAPGVAKMALRTRSVVVTGFCHRLPGNRYDLIFGEPIEPVGSASNEDDIRALLTQIFSRFEYHIKRNPEQWVLLQPVWPVDEGSGIRD